MRADTAETVVTLNTFGLLRLALQEGAPRLESVLDAMYIACDATFEERTDGRMGS